MLQAASLEVGQEIAERLIRLRRQIDLLELEFARLSAEFQASDWFMEEGFTTPINWIRATCHLNGPAAADRVAVGECLELMPKSHQAMEAGELGFSRLVVMARTDQAEAH